MLKKLGTATLVAATMLSFAAPSQAVTLTVPTTAISDIFNPITVSTPNGGFLYATGSSEQNVFGTLVGNIGGFSNAQSGVGPLITTLPGLATYSFNYSLGSGSTLLVELFAYNSSNTFVSSTTLGSLVFGTDATNGSKTYDFTSLISTGEKYSVKFSSTTSGTTSFNGVSLNISAVPEPVEAPALCMLLVAGGALVLRLRNKAVTAKEASLN